MATLFHDLRYAFRNLGNARGFALVAALTLAIGIGANTAIFSIIDTILLRPLPYRDPSQLVRLNETESAPGKYPFALPDFVDWKAQNSTFQDMTLFAWPHDMNLSAGGRPEHVLALPTEANFFSLLGAAPLLGRTWAAGEDQKGKDDVAILSYGLWQSRFAGDPHAVGQSIELNARKYTIVGVMPASFRFPWKSQLWIPQVMDSKLYGGRGSHWANAIGRMKPGVSIKAALADLKVIAATSRKAVSEFERQGGGGGHLAPRRYGGRFPRHAVHDAGGGRPGAADRVRERGEPAAVQSPGAAEGSGRAQRAGRVARLAWCVNC